MAERSDVRRGCECDRRTRTSKAGQVPKPAMQRVINWTLDFSSLRFHRSFGGILMSGIAPVLRRGLCETHAVQNGARQHQ